MLEAVSYTHLDVYKRQVLFRALTHLIDIPVIITWVAIAAFIFYRKQWKIERDVYKRQVMSQQRPLT